MITEPTPQTNLAHIDTSKEDPLILDHYRRWITTHKINTKERPRWASPEEKSNPGYTQESTLDTEHLASCYGLGERIKDTKYRNAILSTMRHYAVNERLFPSDRAVAIIYESTQKGSPARKMMVDFWAYAGSEGWLEDGGIRANVCHEFLEDLVPALLRVRVKPLGKDWPWAENVDTYFVSE